MGVLSSRNQTGQWNGTATTTEAELNVTQYANGVAAPRLLSLENTGAADLLYSTTGGVTWNTMPAGSSYVWDGMGLVYELLLKTSAGTTTYQADASY